MIGLIAFFGTLWVAWPWLAASSLRSSRPGQALPTTTVNKESLASFRK